jgi:hypothetical protein
MVPAEIQGCSGDIPSFSIYLFVTSVWQKKADFWNFDFSFYGMESETN